MASAVLGPEPVDPAIEWAIAENVRLAAEESRAKAAHKEAKTLLEGIPPGRYGDHEGMVTGRSNGPDWEKYAQMLAENYERPPEQRPPLDKIQLPDNPRSTWVQWKRVRKAVLDREAKRRGANPAPTKGETE